MEQNQNRDFHRHVFMQHFCLHDIPPFSKSYPEIESTWPTGKSRRRKSFDTWYYIVTCATLYWSFSSKWKQLMFFQNVTNQSKQGRNCFVTRWWRIIGATFRGSLWSKSKACGGVESKNRYLSWLYRTVIGLSETATGESNS